MTSYARYVSRIITRLREALIRFEMVLFASLLGILFVLLAVSSPYDQHILFGAFIFLSFVAVVIGVYEALFATAVAASFYHLFFVLVKKADHTQMWQGTVLIVTYGVIMALIAGWANRQYRFILAKKRHYSALAEHSIHPILLKSKNKTIQYVSRSVSHLFGYEHSELLGKKIVSIVHPDDKKPLDAFHEKLLRFPGKSTSVEVRIRHADGRWLWMRNDGINLLGDKNISALVTSFQDISQRKEIDAQRQRMLKRERHLRETAENAVRTRDEFLSVASHELKTPLATILLQLQSNLRRILTQSLANFSGETMVKSLKIAEQQCQRMNILMQDLVNFSQITTGRIKLHKEKADLNEVVLSIINRFKEEAKAAGSPIRYRPEGPIIGLFDVVRIEQCIVNLLTNALKYGAGHEVIINVSKENGKGRVSVRDRGIGIDKKHHAAILEPFKRVNDSDMKGLGVGLYITNQIMRAHDGKIAIESKKGQGSIFAITFKI